VSILYPEAYSFTGIGLCPVQDKYLAGACRPRTTHRPVPWGMEKGWLGNGTPGNDWEEALPPGANEPYLFIHTHSTAPRIKSE